MCSEQFPALLGGVVFSEEQQVWHGLAIPRCLCPDGCFPSVPPDSLHAEHLGSYPLLALALDHRPGRNRWVLRFTVGWTVALGPSLPKHLGGGRTPGEGWGIQE